MFSNYLALALAGFALHVLLSVWRACAAKWEDWGPRRKKFTKGFFIACAVMFVFYVAATVSEEGMQQGAGLFFVVAGLLAPEGFKRWHAKRTGATPEEGEQAAGPAGLTLAGGPLPVGAERGHILVAGTGQARQATFKQLISQARARGDTLVVFDPDGRLAEANFQAGSDFVLNPFDTRCVSWSPLAELDGYGVDLLTEELVQAAGVSNQPQEVAAFLAAVMEDLRLRGELTMPNLLATVSQGEREDLAERIQDTRIAQILADEQAFTLLRRRAQSTLAGYDLLPTQGDAFSVRAMLEAEHSGALFITLSTETSNALRHVSAFVCDTAFTGMLSVPTNNTRRAWFVVPEPSALAGDPKLLAWLTRAQAAGATLVLGVPTVSQVQAYLGADGTAIMQACQVRAVTACEDILSARVFEDLLAPRNSSLERQATAQTLLELGPQDVLVQVGAGGALRLGRSAT